MSLSCGIDPVFFKDALNFAPSRRKGRNASSAPLDCGSPAKQSLHPYTPSAHPPEVRPSRTSAQKALRHQGQQAERPRQIRRGSEPSVYLSKGQSPASNRASSHHLSMRVLRRRNEGFRGARASYAGRGQTTNPTPQPCTAANVAVSRNYKEGRISDT